MHTALPALSFSLFLVDGLTWSKLICSYAKFLNFSSASREAMGSAASSSSRCSRGSRTEAHEKTSSISYQGGKTLVALLSIAGKQTRPQSPAQNLERTNHCQPEPPSPTTALLDRSVEKEAATCSMYEVTDKEKPPDQGEEWIDLALAVLASCLGQRRHARR